MTQKTTGRTFGVRSVGISIETKSQTLEDPDVTANRQAETRRETKQEQIPVFHKKPREAGEWPRNGWIRR
jgi:hypothetical protein